MDLFFIITIMQHFLFFVIFTSFLRLQSEIGTAILQTDDPN